MHLFKTLRYDLLLILICVGVFVPRAVRGYDQSCLWFGDNPYYMLTTQSMVKDGDLDLKNQLAGDLTRIRDSIGLGLDGQWYSTHPILMSVAAIPFFITMGNPGYLAFNVLVLVLIVALTYRLALFVAPPAAAFISACIMAFSSQIPGTLINFSPDAFSTVVTLAAIYLVLKEKPLFGGILWGMALLSRTPNLIPYCTVFVFLFLGEKRIKNTVLFLAGSVPFMGIFLLMNKLQYGGFFTLSYSRCMALDEAGKPYLTNIGGHFGLKYFWGGFWGQLLDLRNGLICTNFAAVAGLFGVYHFFKRNRRIAAFILLAALSNYIFHAFFKLWYISGEGASRYLFTTIVLMAMPLAVLLDELFKKSSAPLHR